MRNLQKQRIARLPKYLNWLKQQPCVICGNPGPNDPHHITGAGMGMKGSDDKAVPLCHAHHMDCHYMGQKRYHGNRDLMPDAIRLYSEYLEQS